ncbi:uncharacterized protein PG998_011400 [Apiospora kogelbergensis]|uniref:uncharacterized protein n=1 Tax=Apiospora kogelbergensis TaxID=1337665 RepID=UPI00312F2962
MAPTMQRTLCRAATSTAASSNTTNHALLTTAIRAFSSTSAPQAAQRIPPESPLYINIPTPPLSQAVEDQRRSPLSYKGHLPVPRQIFKQRKGEISKTSPEWFKKSAPAPSSKAALSPTSSDTKAWKRKMAANRRENMEEGIMSLWKRTQRTDHLRKERARRNDMANRAAMNAPPHESDRLTLATVPASVLATRVPQDPQQFESALESLERTRTINDAKSQARRDALQQLYMAARSFIVTEADLEKAVEKEFHKDFFADRVSVGMPSASIWDVEGAPKNVTQMMGDMMGTNTRVVKSDTNNRTVQRHSKIAEELTGGAMDDVSAD